MPGLFDSFDNLDQIKIEDVARWLKPIPQLIQLENYLANRILYPQTLPITQLDLQTDLAILREALRISRPIKFTDSNEMLGSHPFINITMRKILIPKAFLDFAPDLTSLVWAFVDGLLLDRPRSDPFEDLWTIILTGDNEEIIGSVLLPQFEQSGTLEMTIQAQKFKIKAGSLTVLPCPLERCQVDFKLNKGQLLGKSASQIEVYGGKAGIIVDGRIA